MPSAITTALVLKDSTSYDQHYQNLPNNYELIHNLECPDLGEDDLLVNVYACALNKESRKIVKGWKNFSGISVGRDISGKVTKVGKSVTRVKEGDDVVGIIPLDAEMSGCAKFCVLSQYDVVLKPSAVKHTDAVCVLSNAVKAYTALYYLAKIQSGDTILLFNPDSGFGIIVLQIARVLGAKVIAAVDTDHGLNLLRSFQTSSVQIIDTRSTKRTLIDICMEETGGLGVDCIIDNGIDMYSNSAEENQDDLISFNDNPISKLPSKHDAISSLAIGGRWVTSQSDLQLDPPDSQMLFLKCASLHFLFEDSWILSRGVQGKYLHILRDIMDKLSQGVLRANNSVTVNLNDCPKALESIVIDKYTKIVVQTIQA